MVRISKEMLNELFKYISDDNFKYGLIFKITYVYGRSIGEVLRLKKGDVDFRHMTVDFSLPTENVSFILHESISGDLERYVKGKSLGDSDYIFISDDDKVNVYTQKLNYYLKSFITDLNRNVLSWHCPSLVNRDFMKLRGVHLFEDGADVKVINELYRNKNIQSTKDSIGYNELRKERFPCDSLKKVFMDFTDLDVFNDVHFQSNCLFTVCDDENHSLVLEYDYDTGVVNLLGDEGSELYYRVSSLDYDVLFDCVRGLGTGNYRYVDGLKFIKN